MLPNATNQCGCAKRAEGDNSPIVLAVLCRKLESFFELLEVERGWIMEGRALRNENKKECNLRPQEGEQALKMIAVHILNWPLGLNVHVQYSAKVYSHANGSVLMLIKEGVNFKREVCVTLSFTGAHHAACTLPTASSAEAPAAVRLRAARLGGSGLAFRRGIGRGIGGLLRSLALGRLRGVLLARPLVAAVAGRTRGKRRGAGLNPCKVLPHARQQLSAVVSVRREIIAEDAHAIVDNRLPILLAVARKTPIGALNGAVEGVLIFVEANTAGNGRNADDFARDSRAGAVLDKAGHVLRDEGVVADIH